ncbi:MAG: hypothetical protein NC251_06440 [Lachnoclostridium sp.]|nr:hypothetical protein [Lachnospira sp.]MCM1248053.1 hypothetical protein [Lachnoclostridium sp.]
MIRVKNESSPIIERYRSLRMKANEVFRQTIKFVWMKLALGGCAIAFSIVLGLILMAVSALDDNGVVAVYALVIWFCLSVAAVGISQYYLGYLLKAGHIAVVTALVTTGSLPENAFAYGIETVKKKFATAAAYFAVDRLVSGAVKQINSGLDVVGNILGKIPGMESVVSFAKSFVNIALGNVDECCLAYTFYHAEQSAFKSAADGVVIYFQNWKTVLKDALKTAFVAFIVSVAAGLLLFLVTIGALGLLGMPGLGVFFVSLMLTMMIVLIVKSAVMDSYTMVCMVCSYMQVAPSTEITFDLYDKLCGLSSKFKSLFQRAA